MTDSSFFVMLSIHMPTYYGEHFQLPQLVKRKLVFLGIFFAIVPFTLLSSILTLVALAKDDPETRPVWQSYTEFSQSGAQIYASLPAEVPQVAGTVVGQDARVLLVTNYLKRYNSPLIPHASFIVKTADKYDMDFRLITAIAQQESNLCKKIPPGSFNCWGWGIHSRGTLGFSSFEEGIETVTRGLKKEYIDKGFRTPEEIMSKYTPSSNGSWAIGVSEFMVAMQ